MNEVIQKLINMLEREPGITDVERGDDDLIDLTYNGRIYRLELDDVGSPDD